MPSVTRTIHFEKTQERYELTASPACVHLDGGGNQTETVTVRLMHYKGKESDEITGKYVTITDGRNSASFKLPAEINQSGSTVISQSLDDREHGAPDSLTVIGILGANNLVIPVVHDGMGVSKADIVFAVGTSQSEAPNFSANSPTSATSLITYDNREYYLWQCTMITYTAGSPTFNGYQCLGQVKTFASVTEQYATGTASAATSSWVNDSPASLSRNKGSYLWTRTKLSYNSGNPSYSPNESGTCIGYWGTDGENAVTVQISPEAILHKKATTSSQYSLAIRVWNGKTAVPASGFSAKIQSKPNGLSEYMIASATDSYINYLGISINANTEINGDITIAVTYNGNTYTKVVPFKTVVNGDPGIKGEKGASLRGPQAWSDLSVGYQFYQGKDGEEYKDVVLYNGNYYSCIKTHQKNSSNYPTSTIDTNNGYWKLADKFELVATNLFLANYALIKNLGVEAIEMKDSKGNILFKVRDGNVICKTGTFENITIGSGCVNYGVNRQPFASGGGAHFEGDDVWLETELHDNLAFNDLKDGWQTFASLPFDQKANGRRILIVRSVWNNISPYDITQVSAPDGKYFFEDGLKNKYLKVKANEALLLAGYGDETNFMGWIVLQRIPMWTIHPHGSVQRAIYEGKCYENGTKLKYKAYNGAKLTCSRFDKGSYKISFGTPFKSTDEYEVMLTACGMNGDTAHAVYASLDKKNVSYFTVRCADDSSWNDASFLFQVIPTWDWITNS